MADGLYRLGSVASIAIGQTDVKIEQKGALGYDVPWIWFDDLVLDKIIKRKISSLEFIRNNTKKQLLKSGVILVSSIGRSAEMGIVKEDKSVCVSRSVITISPRKNIIRPLYLYAYLWKIKDRIIKKKFRTTKETMDIINNIYLPRLSTKEQDKIIEKLVPLHKETEVAKSKFVANEFEIFSKVEKIYAKNHTEEEIQADINCNKRWKVKYRELLSAVKEEDYYQSAKPIAVTGSGARSFSHFASGRAVVASAGKPKLVLGKFSSTVKLFEEDFIADEDVEVFSINNSNAYLIYALVTRDYLFWDCDYHISNFLEEEVVILSQKELKMLRNQLEEKVIERRELRRQYLAISKKLFDNLKTLQQ